jgi:hypothetical protein
MYLGKVPVGSFCRSRATRSARRGRSASRAGLLRSQLERPCLGHRTDQARDRRTASLPKCTGAQAPPASARHDHHYRAPPSGNVPYRSHVSAAFVVVVRGHSTPLSHRALPLERRFADRSARAIWRRIRLSNRILVVEVRALLREEKDVFVGQRWAILRARRQGVWLVPDVVHPEKPSVVLESERQSPRETHEVLRPKTMHQCRAALE